MEDPTRFAKVLPASAGHQPTIQSSGTSVKRNPLQEKGPSKHSLGAITTVGLPVMGNPGVRAMQPGEKSTSALAALPLRASVAPSAEFFFSQALSEHLLMLTRGNEPGITVTQVHHKYSAFRDKKCFLSAALPTN